jgi:choline transport protein
MASTDSKELGVEMHAIDTEQGDNPDMAGTHISAQSMGTAYDQRDMRVMGKLQELRVRDGFN